MYRKKQGGAVQSGSPNNSPQYLRECEARTWLRVLFDRVDALIQDDENHLAMATADDIKRIYSEWHAWIIKKRGADGLQKLLIEMHWQWCGGLGSVVINSVYQGPETLAALLKSGAGLESNIPGIAQNRHGG